MQKKSYFIPFFKGGNAYPTYTYVCKIQEGSVLCEYMVNGNQIVYECYSNETENTIEYYSVNYVKNGKYPVLEEKKAIIYKDLSCIKIEEYNNRMEPDGKQ